MGTDDYTDDDLGRQDPLRYPGYARARTSFEVVDGQTIYLSIDHEGGEMEVTEEEYRIVDQYEAARRRQAEAQVLAEQRWKTFDPPPPPPEPEPEDIPPEGKLTGRQAEFCRHYVAQPVATRAAVLAGYSEESAASRGSRLLKNALVLERIAQLRAERSLHYVLERDTLHDKLEAVFFEALGERNHAAAISALRLQAGLAGLIFRAAQPRSDAPSEESVERDRLRPLKVEKSQGERGTKNKKKQGARARKVRKRQ